MVSKLTRHHLIPRTRHRNRKNKRDFDRQEVHERIVMLCRPCHNQVHAVLSEKTLEREYNTLAELAEHPEIARFVAWIRNKPDGIKVPVRESQKKR